MVMCDNCQKGINTVSFSRHKKGSSGAGGTWALRAPIHKRIQKPNLHSFKGLKLCTKCLRAVKKAITPATPTVSA
jgi:ribosomal protein L28